MNTISKQNTTTLGLIGFIISLVSLVTIFIPLFGLVIWITGIIFSIIGVSNKKKGFAIAGLIISFSWIFILIIVLLKMNTNLL